MELQAMFVSHKWERQHVWKWRTSHLTQRNFFLSLLLIFNLLTLLSPLRKQISTFKKNSKSNVRQRTQTQTRTVFSEIGDCTVSLMEDKWSWHLQSTTNQYSTSDMTTELLNEDHPRKTHGAAFDADNLPIASLWRTGCHGSSVTPPTKEEDNTNHHQRQHKVETRMCNEMSRGMSNTLRVFQIGAETCDLGSNRYVFQRFLVRFLLFEFRDGR